MHFCSDWVLKGRSDSLHGEGRSEWWLILDSRILYGTCCPDPQTYTLGYDFDSRPVVWFHIRITEGTLKNLNDQAIPQAN